tara:strand:+ start:303 stop:1586 length:1284 start_codon:yes stop_codon:yes gene_type:complete
MSKTTSNFFGDGADTSVFNPFTLSSNNSPRACIGPNRRNGNFKWYGIYNTYGSKHDPHDLSFCQHCGENAFKLNEVWQITNDEYPNLLNELVCDIFKKDNKLVGEKRCISLPFEYVDNRNSIQGAIELNINLIDKDGTFWTPVTLGTDDSDISAKENNVLIAKIPTHQRWQFVIKCGRNFYQEDLYYKIESIKAKDGREVKVKNENGSTDFYIPLNNFYGSTHVNGYETGLEGEQFFFIAPPTKEIEDGIADASNKFSNIFQGTLTIYKKIMKKKKYNHLERRTFLSKYNEYSEDDGEDFELGNQYESLTFFSNNAKKSTKCTTGGTNLGTSGIQKNVKSTIVDAIFNEVSSVKFTIQLVNNESEEERLYFANIIETQTRNWREQEISKLMEKQKNIDFEIEKLKNGSRNPRVLQHSSFKQQEQHLI